MMRRIIAHLLIIAVLATNVAWAMDDCFSPSATDVSGVAQTSELPDDLLNDGVCDELCVGWLHLVAIIPETRLDYAALTHHDVARTDISYHSLEQIPPIRPPQI